MCSYWSGFILYVSVGLYLVCFRNSMLCLFVGLCNVYGEFSEIEFRIECMIQYTHSVQLTLFTSQKLALSHKLIFSMHFPNIPISPFTCFQSSLLFVSCLINAICAHLQIYSQSVSATYSLIDLFDISKIFVHSFIFVCLY